ncbi:unnamed protein product [Phytophthora lilii]|uniref:Unnamed protein product n=1 Tax=Phytophthora lilii TaxID=2077276 RepID=A0A9W6UCT8_9STRA|nr:unnamed protein product [Phytophthora lilii]
MIRVVAGTYEGLLYGWECPTVASGESTKMKLTFGYAAHAECIKSVALMAAKQGKTLLSGSTDEMIKLVGKVTHKDIDTRIRCLQVVYPHGDDKLPWIVLATSDGAFQIWDFASFTLDASSPEESNKSVEPMASTVLLTKPRVTCLSVCVASEKIGSGSSKGEPVSQTKTKKVKKVTEKKPTAPAAGVPHVVVELDDKADDDESKKRKAGDDAEQKNKSKNKKRKQKKSQQ